MPGPSHHAYCHWQTDFKNCIHFQVKKKDVYVKTWYTVKQDLHICIQKSADCPLFPILENLMLDW